MIIKVKSRFAGTIKNAVADGAAVLYSKNNKFYRLNDGKTFSTLAKAWEGYSYVFWVTEFHLAG